MFPLNELRIVALIWTIVVGILGFEFVGPELSARGWVDEAWAGVAGTAVAIAALPVLAVLLSAVVLSVLMFSKMTSRTDDAE